MDLRVEHVHFLFFFVCYVRLPEAKTEPGLICWEWIGLSMEVEPVEPKVLPADLLFVG